MPGPSLPSKFPVPTVPARAVRQPLSSDPELAAIWAKVLMSLQYHPGKHLIYFGPVSAYINAYIDNSVPTCYIDANARMGMNAEFIKGMTFVQQVTALLHEALHWIHRHPQRLKKWIEAGHNKEPFLIAEDVFIWHWIDQIPYAHTFDDKVGKMRLQLSSLENLIKGGITLEKDLEEYTVEELALLIEKQCPKHKYECQACVVASDAGDGIESDERGLLEPIPDWHAVIEACAKAVQMAQGTMPAGAELPVEPKKPRLSPIAAVAGELERNIYTDYSYRKPDRRLAFLSRKLITASPQHYGREAAIVIDTSGSTSGMWNEFYGYLAELRRRQHATIYLVVIDAQVGFSGWIRPDQVFPTLAFRGGGGSDFRPAFDNLAELRQQCPRRIVVLTDGRITWPDSAPGFLRGRELITITTDKPAPFGRTVYYPKE